MSYNTRAFIRKELIKSWRFTDDDVEPIIDLVIEMTVLGATKSFLTDSDYLDTIYAICSLSNTGMSAETIFESIKSSLCELKK